MVLGCGMIFHDLPNTGDGGQEIREHYMSWQPSGKQLWNGQNIKAGLISNKDLSGSVGGIDSPSANLNINE